MLTCSTASVAQDTISVMYYNLLNFPSAKTNREDTLRKIVQYVKPDLFLVCELESSSAASDILNKSLNVGGISYYQMANFLDGPDTDNQLFYNSNKIQLVSQQNIPTSLRDISEYVVYSKQGLGTTTDTVFMHLYCVHLKAGSQPSNEQDRKNESLVLKNYLDGKNFENVFVGGDMNLYYNTEPAYPILRTTGSIDLFDPVNQVGTWHANSFYATVHTQSARSTSLYGGAGGGLDDRFDQILVSDDVITGKKNLKYISGTYKAVGQDGQHFNKSVNSGTNSAVPDSVANALYYMSDHLPVYMEMLVDYTLGNPIHNNPGWLFYHQTVTGKLIFQSPRKENEVSITVYDAAGREVFNIRKNLVRAFTLPLNLEQGFYVAILKSGVQVSTTRFFHGGN